MIEDIVLVIILAVVGFVYFYYQRRVKKPGPANAEGKLAKWLAGLSSAGSGLAGKTNAPTTRGSSYVDELVAGLDEVYGEFTQETDAIRKEFDRRLEELRDELRREVRAEVAAAVRLEMVRRSTGTFAIADADDGPPPRARRTSAAQEEPQVNAAAEDAVLPLATGATFAIGATSATSATGTSSATGSTRRNARPGGAMESVDGQYFEILDLLYQGKSPEQIAQALKVNLNDVYKVQELLQSPGDHPPM